MKSFQYKFQRKITGNPRLLGFALDNLPADVYTSLSRFIKKGAESHGDEYIVMIQYPFKLRSTGWRSMNHHFNGHCQQISEDTGNDFDQVKHYVKRKAISRGLDYTTMPDGSVEPISETRMNTVECGYCIDEVHLLAAELNITLKEYEEGLTL